MKSNPEASVTFLLQQFRTGDSGAREELFSAINCRLRQLANALMQSERSDHTLQPTALVNEACLRMLKQDVVDSVENRKHLFAVTVQVMQQVLVDHARKRGAIKRGGNRTREAMDVVLDTFEAQHGLEFFELEQALDRLKEHSERQHQVLTLRFFSGLSIADTAELLGCSRSTVESDWRWARAKLYSWLNE